MNTDSKTLLSVKNLSVHFRTSSRVVEAVNNIGFDLNAGETLALVGESGSGKSVTALSLLQLLPYPMASHPSGSITYKGKELINADKYTLSEIRGDQIGMIFQEPMTALNPLHTIQKQISEVLMLHQLMTVKEAREETLSLLNKVKIRHPEKRLSSYPHQLSGGQRQRVMIAMALANKPDILIADEPTTALDVTVQAEILKLLGDLQEEMGMAILLITHDLSLVKKIAERVVVMKDGEFVESGSTASLFSAPQHDYTKLLLSSSPGIRKDFSMKNLDTIISCKDLKVWFPVKKGFLKRTVDHIKAVNGVTLDIAKGRTLGIVGESGSGKTTLALALLKLINSEGEIAFNDKRIDTLKGNNLKDIRPLMQMVFQDPYGSLSPRMTIENIVSEGLEAHDIGDEKSRQEAVVSILEDVEIDPASRFRYPHEFSGGQRQRIAIARAMIMRPKFVVLDEPTSALDRTVQGQIIDLLLNLQEKFGLSYLFISHDLSVVRALSDTILVLKNGKMVEFDTREKIFNQPEHEYTKRLIKAATEFKL